MKYVIASPGLRTACAICLAVATHFLVGSVQAAETNTNDPFIRGDSSTSPESTIGGWSLNIDNDLFTGGDSDRDYTGGIVLGITGSRTRDWLFSLDNVRHTLTRLSGFNRFYDSDQTLSLHSFEFGFTLFTPSDITVAEPILNDRPYASLFFVATAAQHVLPERKLSFQSVFTVGALGLSLADSVQSGIHRAIGSALPEGWDNQISAGGEPTARFSLSVQKTLIEGGGPGLSTQLSINSEANLGFTTDASVGFGFRWGKLARPWYTFNPHPAEYISVGTPPDSSGFTDDSREIYFYAGANVKYRLYNAILQGQFRDSELVIDRDQLNPLVAEGWAGVLAEVGAGYRFGLFVRGRTAEIDKGIARNPMWGGILISRSL